jgi:dynactin 1
MAELAIGQTVELNDGRTATIRFIGQTEFAPGEWIGVELEDNGGKNDGSVKGERYFECEMGRGMFVRLAAITSIIDQPPPVTKPVGVKKAARPSSVTGSGLGKRLSNAPDPAAGKRMSMNAASPSPAARGSRPSSMLRVSIKSGLMSEIQV